MFALTLIKTDAPLQNAHVAVLQGHLEELNLRVDTRPPDWHEEGHSVRGWLLDKPTPEQMGVLRSRMVVHGADIICEASSQSKLRLACFDLESTCIQQESLDLLAAFLGHSKQVENITAQGMRGEISLEDSFLQRFALLKGVGQNDINAVIEQLYEFPHMHKTVQWLQSLGVRCVLVSSGVDIFVRPMATRYGFDDVFCSHVDLLDDRLVGTYRSILSKQGKADVTARLITEMGIDKSQALAMGDGANDALMMDEVGRPFGWRPKPILSAITPNQFNHCDWRGLRYALV